MTVHFSTWHTLIFYGGYDNDDLAYFENVFLKVHINFEGDKFLKQDKKIFS